MRYEVIEGSESVHCCFGATVVDTERDRFAGLNMPRRPHLMCECFDLEDAQRICDALNKLEESV